MQPLGILRVISLLSSLGGIPAELVFCFATGNTALGDIPGIGMAMIDGIVRCGRSRNTPRATEIPVVMGVSH